MPRHRLQTAWLILAALGWLFAVSGLALQSAAAVFEVTGPSAFAVHALNILLHAVNATMLAAVATRLGLSRLAAVVAGLLLLCFPGNVEAVAWASGIQDVLLATGCLVFALASTVPSRLAMAAPLAACALVVALGTKETAVVTPLLALALWWKGEGRKQGPLLRAVAVGLPPAVGYGIWRVLTVGIPESQLAAHPRWVIKEVLCGAFGNLAVPFTRDELSRYPGLGIGLAWFFGLLLVGAAWVWQRDPKRFATANRAVFWVVLSIAPVYALLLRSPDLQGSRYLYLPACGWCLLVAGMALDTGPFRWRGLAPLGIAALLVLSSIGIRSHLDDWQKAARLRDRVLASAADEISQTECAVLHFADVPDSVGGAYVFRNGLLEALPLGGTPRSQIALGVGDPACTVHWRGTAFH